MENSALTYCRLEVVPLSVLQDGLQRFRWVFNGQTSVNSCKHTSWPEHCDILGELARNVTSLFFPMSTVEVLNF